MTPWPDPSAERWLGQLRLEDSSGDWTRYVEYLASLAGDQVEQKKRGFDEMSHGWAIGTTAWKQTAAREHAHLALHPDLPRAEVRDFRRARWEIALDEALQQWRKNSDDVARAPKCARWKVEIAQHLRKAAGAPYRWIAERLVMGSPTLVRVAVCRLANM